MRVSVTSLGLLNECHRCLWKMVVKRQQRPSMFSTLPSALDKITQKEVESHTMKGNKPSWLAQIPGDVIHIRKKLEADVQDMHVVGILDDLVKDPDDNSYTVIDYKTSRAPYTQANAEKYYQLQMDAYALLCERSGYGPVKNAYLVFFTPSVTDRMVNNSSQASFAFDVTPLKLSVSQQRAKDTIIAVQKVVELDVAPEAAADCRWCNW